VSILFELRRYRLKPGAFDELLTLFEREFVHTQEAVGMDVPAIYRDIGDPDAFVWLRSFESIDARAQALATFYTGDVWNRFGPVANATMVNSDNVLLLAPGRLDPALLPRSGADRDDASGTAGKGLITISICSLAPGREQEFAIFFETEARPLLEQAGARIDATFVTAAERNSFPGFPCAKASPCSSGSRPLRTQRPKQPISPGSSRQQRGGRRCFPLWTDGYGARSRRRGSSPPGARAIAGRRCQAHGQRR
jgi:hypothetical protein